MNQMYLNVLHVVVNVCETYDLRKTDNFKCPRFICYKAYGLWRDNILFTAAMIFNVLM